jgi:hypothetical protein
MTLFRGESTAALWTAQPSAFLLLDLDFRTLKESGWEVENDTKFGILTKAPSLSTLELSDSSNLARTLVP